MIAILLGHLFKRGESLTQRSLLSFCTHGSENLRPRVSGTVTASVDLDKDSGALVNLTRAEITLSGDIVPGETISFNGASVTVQSGDDLSDIATRIASSTVIARAAAATVSSSVQSCLSHCFISSAVILSTLPNRASNSGGEDTTTLCM